LCTTLIRATGSIIARSTTIIKSTNAITTTNDPTIVIKMIDATIILVAEEEQY
jgi:hypothetical protein